MKYLLDTNVCIKYLNEDSIIRQRLENYELEDIAVCLFVKLELFYGAMRSDNPDQFGQK
ncbi:MAG: type II toxin-antitoxin system VapC family toxin [Nostoc sp.]|uniref:type II toxin-antitoxin system VapC family toxin n=1 Tax=Nostoc sp. TaxID=1180 RepID=UPI002FFA52A5